ncbi:hypothetical protein [Halomonas sp. E14]|uniref:hypothetical protein n=1 Tax=Halomonas sp. E14 TaxID=3397245 RepID=UPI00403EA1C4
MKTLPLAGRVGGMWRIVTVVRGLRRVSHAVDGNTASVDQPPFGQLPADDKEEVRRDEHRRKSAMSGSQKYAHVAVRQVVGLPADAEFDQRQAVFRSRSLPR